ncbi:MAG: putative metal-dependent hydrolase [Gemmatimonadetes bacterium]|nr:putative metal-dependent hydrolase [Gemmatimonadota bacterium]
MTIDDQELEALRFPIGRAAIKPDLTGPERRSMVDRLADLPRRVREVVSGMDDAALDTPYRRGGWTVRQVVHHLPDSHMNAYVRFKLAATEEEPAIRTYQEADWARLSDSAAPVDASLDLLESLHDRWSRWLRTFDEDSWRRVYVHPKSGRVQLQEALQLYVWHGDHHLAHVQGGFQQRLVLQK